MLINVQTHDGYMLKGKLSLPENDKVIEKLIIIIDGAGPTTYNNRFHTELFTDKGIACFSFNKRGVDVTDDPPYYTINYDEYETYTPLNSIEDIYNIIKTLKKIERLAMCNILLNGWSEGTILAPLFAAKYPNLVNGLFLCGYSNVNLKDMQIWQCSKFDGGDALLAACFNAVEQNDNQWLKNNIGVTAQWLKGHYGLTSNKHLLPKLDLSIHIFHGTSDGFCDVQGAYDISEAFTQSNKQNLTVNIFDNHGHGLETDGCSDGKTSDGTNLSDGMKSFLNAIANF
jgi:hypothetical protein